MRGVRDPMLNHLLLISLLHQARADLAKLIPDCPPDIHVFFCYTLQHAAQNPSRHKTTPLLVHAPREVRKHRDALADLLHEAVSGDLCRDDVRADYLLHLRPIVHRYELHCPDGSILHRPRMLQFPVSPFERQDGRIPRLLASNNEQRLQ